MKRLILIALLLSGVAAYGQEGQPSWRKTFSLEVGVAPGPLHMQSHFISPSWEEEKALAELGQAASSNNAFHPSVSLSGVWRTGYRWETVATAGVSWSICRITQYDSFGIDPEGKPRYDLTKGTPAGWKALSPVASLTVQCRVFWNPRWKVQAYSAFGAGFSTRTEFLPLPSFIPAGVRLGGGPLYFYAETGFTPFSSFLHGGLGWRF